MATKLDLAYTAGLIDGEGCFFARSSPAIKFSNTDLGLINYLVKTFGGKVNTKQKLKNKTFYSWYLYGQLAVDFTEQILPFLIYKKPQAELILNFYKTKIGSGNKLTEEIKAQRKIICQKLKDLKKL